MASFVAPFEPLPSLQPPISASPSQVRCAKTSKWSSSQLTAVTALAIALCRTRGARAARPARSKALRRAGAAAVTKEEEDEDQYYRSATPRERQFGMYDRRAGSRSSQSGAVELPLSQLHVVAAQRQLPVLLEAVDTDASQAIQAWSELLSACQRQAPELLSTWSCGLSPLLRLALVVPRSQWLRSPEESWCDEAPGPVQHEGPEGPRLGTEALPKLEKLIRHLLTKYDDAPMDLAAGFLWSDGAGGTLREREDREVVLCSGAGASLCVSFIRLFREVCQGERKPLAAAQDLLSPTLTKKMVNQLLGGSTLPTPPPVEVPDEARHIQPLAVTLASPLMLLRRAQLAQLNAPEAMAEALAQTNLAKDLGSPEEEAFALEVMSWMSRFADSPELEDKHSAAQCVEWLLAQRSLDAKFSLVLSGNPRAPKKVLAAAKRDAATLELQRLQSSGQRFLPNPAGIKGFVKRGVLAAFGSPYESPSGSWLPKGLKAFVGEGSLVEPVAPNSWHGDDYEPCNAEARFLKDPQRLRKATVRIDEIMSFEYMQHVGQVMANCLRVERRGGMSLVKYLSRAKSRDSSFWVMTITAEPEEDEEEAPVQHLLLMEVYNGLRVIHQAEGPHPRRWPRLDAWRWLEEWADQEKLRPDGPEGVTVGPYEAYDADMDRWDIRRCFLW
ncbi:unnamed protein product [Effrenium voratum]|uniref:Uncharacterized protein n=1 Tax=Effrenium voratum TaxID=2562239 RepID=A0AA36J9A6_9DINO|nr:unnamed protein product [Effrenium voratum]